jgi:hypothetical protein
LAWQAASRSWTTESLDRETERFHRRCAGISGARRRSLAVAIEFESTSAKFRTGWTEIVLVDRDRFASAAELDALCDCIGHQQSIALTPPSP